jgi:sporulation protein YlmC with PRC-barrel domain
MAKALLALALLPGLAAAADILDARYDAAADALVVAIAYRGTQDGHEYELRWGPCLDGNIAARLVDRQGMEPAREGFRVTGRFPLKGLECRPANVTLRLGRVSHATVFVPGRDAAAVPKPWLDSFASDLIGSPVKNARGEDLGRIEDFVVDLGTGEVREALLRFNGALYGFPLTAFRPIVGNERLLLTVDRASLLKEQGLHGRQPLPEGQAFVSELIRGPVVDLVLNFSSRQVRAALLDNGKGVPLSALGPVP